MSVNWPDFIMPPINLWSMPKRKRDYMTEDEYFMTGAGSALDSQIGGDHYKKLAIQPVEYIQANGLRFIEGSIVKYVTRWRDKNGIEDLKKARHFLDLLIEFEGK